MTNTRKADGPLSGIISEDDYTLEDIKELERRADRKIARELNSTLADIGSGSMKALWDAEGNTIKRQAE